MRNFVSTILLFVCASSHAFVVDLDPNDSTTAIGIRDLVIQGAAYDVVFSHSQGPHNGLNAGDIFIDEAGATAAVLAVNAALNSVGGLQSVGVSNDNRFLVAWEFNTTGCGSQGDRGTCTIEGRKFGGIWTDFFHELDSTNNSVPVEFARFSAAVVPIPAAAWLFGSAIGLLVWIRKRNPVTGA